MSGARRDLRIDLGQEQLELYGPLPSMARDMVPISILSGSMTAGGILAGSLIFVRPVSDFSKEVHIGVVVTVVPKADDPALVTHRVIVMSFSAKRPL